MRLRVKFSKQEPLQYLGHLDTMRFFQKAIRRAGLPARYSEGFSPHILLSFASPLGVGKVTTGDYFDLEMEEALPIHDLLDKLQSEMPEGMKVLDAAYITEGKQFNAMRSVAAAAYAIRYADEVDFSEKEVHAFLLQEKIWFAQETKKGIDTKDLRPGIFCMEIRDQEIYLLLSASSALYIQPEAVLQAYSKYVGQDLLAAMPRICRIELYARSENGSVSAFIPLLQAGTQEERADVS